MATTKPDENSPPPSPSPSPPTRGTFFQLGEIRLPTDEDFEHVAALADDYEGWTQKYNKNGTSVWTKNTQGSQVKVVKVQTEFDGVSPEVMYDMVHDGGYRKHWDEAMITDENICRLDTNSTDIGYYAMRCPAPLKNRDFVSQRCWRVRENEYIIFSHSVAHEKYPPRSQFIRGVIYLTGYLIRKTPSGCYLTYITQTDPRGHVPKWILNLVFTKVAPRVVMKLRKAADAYQQWKEGHDPDNKPWLYPDQNTVPLVSLDSLAVFDELPLSPLPVKVGKGPWEKEEDEEEEEGEDVPDGVVIDPLLVCDNGLENGHS